jgi:hypothetical protein
MLQRVTFFRPAFHKVAEDPAKNYGVGSMEVFMVLKGEKGAVHFIFMTGMYLPETYKWWADTGLRSVAGRLSHSGYPSGTMGVDVGYHAYTPHYEGQTISRDKCEWIDGPCYGDGSALRADEWFDIIMRKGSDEIWKMLEEDYKERFHSEI